MSQVGPGGFENVAGRVGSGQEVFEMSRVGSRRANKFSILAGRVGSRGFQISRVGPGRVKRFSNLTGRVGSIHEVFKMSRVG